MSRNIGMKGLPRVAAAIAGSIRAITFRSNASATKVVALDPSKSYALFAAGAGPSDVTVQVTKDSPDAVSNGTAVYVALKTYAAMAATGGYLGDAKNCTAVKVTHAKNGTGTDDATKVANLGGRFQFKAVENANGNDTGMGSYTALTAT